MHARLFLFLLFRQPCRKHFHLFVPYFRTKGKARTRFTEARHFFFDGCFFDGVGLAWFGFRLISVSRASIYLENGLLSAGAGLFPLFPRNSCSLAGLWLGDGGGGTVGPPPPKKKST